MGRSHRSALTFFTSGIWYATMMVASLVATPLVLRWLGQDRYGAYLYALQWLGYLALLEFGLSTAIMPLLVKFHENAEKRNDAMGVAFRAWRLVTVANLLGSMLIIAIVPLSVKGDIALRGDMRLGLLIVMASVVLVPLAPLRSLLESSQRGYLVIAGLIVQSGLTTGLGVLAAWLTYHFHLAWGISGQFVAIVAGNATFQLIIVWHAWRRFPGVIRQVLATRADPQMHAELHRTSGAAFALQASNQIGLLTDVIVIGSMLGPALVVPFSITQRLINIGQGQLKNIGTSVWAALADLHAKGEHAVFNHRMLSLGRLIVVLGLAAMVPIAAYDRPFVEKWVGAKEFGGETLTMLACLNSILFALMNLWEMTFNATGHVQARVPVAIVSGIVNLAASILCTLAFGLIGPVLGTTIAFVGINLWWYPRLLQKIYSIPQSSLFGSLSKPLVTGLPYGGAVWWWAHSHTPWGWIGLSTEMAVTGLVYLGIAWLLVFNAEDREFMRYRFGPRRWRLRSPPPEAQAP